MDTVYTKLESSDLLSISDQHRDEAAGLLVDEGLVVVTRNKSLSKTFTHWAIHVLALIVIALLVVESRQQAELDRTKCWSLFNWWSPVNEGVAPFKFVEQRFNGSLWYKSPYKGPPSPQEERAWSDATKYGMFALTEHDLIELHNLGNSPDVSPERSARYPPELGEGYVATTIGAHQLHCLHNLWMDHHRDDFPAMQKKLKEVPEMYELHYQHCVDFIRQSLMCHYDTGIITYNWVRDLQNPTPNANVPHKCVDLGPLNDWLAERAIILPDDFVWSQPEGAFAMEHHPS